VEAAIPRAQGALDASIYEVRIQRATNEERRYLRAMAELGDGHYRSGQVAAMLGRTTPAVSMTRARLIEKGLIYATEDYGHVDYTVPRFGEFLRRHMRYDLRAQPQSRSAG
jgi:Mn-dependent DtxR family transcriptional regulator